MDDINRIRKNYMNTVTKDVIDSKKPNIGISKPDFSQPLKNIGIHC